MTNTEKTTTAPIRRAGLALTAGLAALLALSACTGGSDATGSSSADGQRTETSATTGSTTKPAKAEKLTLDSAQAGGSSSSEAPKARLKVVGQVSLADQPGAASDKIYLAQPDEQTVRAYWIDRANDKKSQETWVDLALGDGGKSLTVEGPARSEAVRGYGPEPGKPFTSGARKGVPDPTAGDTSGVFLFAAGAPGKATSEAPTAQRQDYRKVVSAVTQDGYVYLTVLGFPGVLVAELEKAQG